MANLATKAFAVIFILVLTHFFLTTISNYQLLGQMQEMGCEPKSGMGLDSQRGIQVVVGVFFIIVIVWIFQLLVTA